uniref:Ig-like domain-containing protein n=1 Tax=Chrysemys picta bellii TaxID=8478 RepID=A0A8C3FKX1_CHRPI
MGGWRARPPYPHPAVSPPVPGGWVQLGILQSPPQLWLKSGDTAQLHCKTLEDEVTTMWYKEQSGSLRWIYWSSEFASPDGKYSSEANTVANTFSLIISNVQREDSGIYYCGLFSFMYLQPNFGNGTRLIVTGEFPMAQNNDIPMLGDVMKKITLFFGKIVTDPPCFSSKLLVFVQRGNTVQAVSQGIGLEIRRPGLYPLITGHRGKIFKRSQHPIAPV